MKTSELTGAALDWAVAKCEGKEARQVQGLGRAVRLFRTIGYDPTPWQPSTNWAQGGPIIEREEINVDVSPTGTAPETKWVAIITGENGAWVHGTTPLIAAMRCYVTSKLGDEVEIPKELI